MEIQSQAFEVRRYKLADTRIVSEAMATPERGEALLRIDAFALTANNITYGVTGDMIGYWQFFPAADTDWGRIPVWGFADVVSSDVDGVAEGDRFYGYFPMAGHLLVQPAAVGDRSFTDGAAHRAELPAVYNQYQRCAADPLYRPEHEAMLMLFRPLFTTGFFIDDFLADNDFFGAGTVLLSSASSKTAVALAWLLHRARKGQVRVVGLTSPGNKRFVESLGCYDTAVTYDEPDALPKGPVVYVDMAGNGDLRASVHGHYADKLAYSCSVGVTHWESAALGGNDKLPGPKPELFFAPTQVAKRNKDWGPAVIAERLAGAWTPFVDAASGWLAVRREHGPGGVSGAYRSLLENRANPAEGLILSL
ncbi:DUF2855 family protein [Pseudohaliea rubra]|uniref:Bll1370 protein n=1 Tax=Pseudohaliea rubra DSM 19751 TaxID=1265313 RepID=A0A095X235_9GAMM|nr:DUF2855 family protein [Pseudohaliea rubra]KGE04949.1 hypothetical protein HRUBRA_00422 [Pseudohaliea rubra DSM 19751]